MTRELFVSSTPHETTVGMVEDDLLAEIYLERENEYTLAGSIYKGRVTRVLPGMQSAFVDIGLERDAFLYVSDFMELENEEDDLEEIPAGRPVLDFKTAQPTTSDAASEPQTEILPDVATTLEHQPSPESRPSAHEDRDRGGWRGRRRRGRRDREFDAPGPSRPAPSESRPERSEYGPPAGYQPILLPGESISKYRGLAPSASAKERSTPPSESPKAALSETFPADEPLFAEADVNRDRSEGEQSRKVAPETLSGFEEADQERSEGPEREPSPVQIREAEQESRSSDTAVGSSEWDREQK